MGTNAPDVEGAKEPLDPAVHRSYLPGRQEPASDPGLVAQNTGGDAQGPQTPQRLPGLGHRVHPGRVAVVGLVANEGAVPVEQDSPQLWSGKKIHSIPVPRFRTGQTLQRVPCTAKLQNTRTWKAAGVGGSRNDGRPVLLVLRALKLGDLLVAVPALRGLCRAFPHHRLLYAAPGWLEDAVALVGGFELLPTRGLDEPLSLGPGTVDIAVNLHGRGPESQGRIEALRANETIAHRCGRGPGPSWLDGISERDRWTRLLQWHGIPADPAEVFLADPGIPAQHPGATVIHVGAAHGSRLWPEERFTAVAERLGMERHSLVFTGGAADRERALRVAVGAGAAPSAVLAGKQTLRQFAAQVADARLVVSADTGAAHLASAYGRPSVVLFGPAPPEEWGPPPGPHIALTQTRLRRGDVFSADPDPALLGVSVQDVLDAVRELGLL